MIGAHAGISVGSSSCNPDPVYVPPDGTHIRNDCGVEIIEIRREQG